MNKRLREATLRLQEATLFNLEGTQIEIGNKTYILNTLFAERVSRDLGQRHAVFFGEQVDDQVPVVIKLRYEAERMNPRVCPYAQTSGVKKFAERIFKHEVEALQATADLQVTPSLLAHGALSQGPSSSHPGGYIYAIATSKLPGQPASELANIGESERIEIRDQVISGLEAIRLRGFCINDGHSDEVIYDRTTGAISLTCLGHISKIPPAESARYPYQEDSGVVWRLGQGVWRCF